MNLTQSKYNSLVNPRIETALNQNTAHPVLKVSPVLRLRSLDHRRNDSQKATLKDTECQKLSTA